MSEGHARSTFAGLVDGAGRRSDGGNRAALAPHAIDIVMTDVEMPDIDDPKSISRLRALPSIYVTG
jgi:CheY-like chemotaxis protein